MKRQNLIVVSISMQTLHLQAELTECLTRELVTICYSRDDSSVVQGTVE